MPNENSQTPETASPPPPSSQPEVKKWKKLSGAAFAVALVAGLYFLNRFWITPAATHPIAESNGEHPLAPDFSLKDINGEQISLANYKGKVVMLDFWATYCGPCRIEIPAFVEFQNRYRDQGFVIVGLSEDYGPEPVHAFYKEYKLNYTVAMSSEKIATLFGGIIGLPTTFLIGRDGRIYSKHVGATDPSVFEEEIKRLLAVKGGEALSEFKQVGGTRSGEEIELGDPAEINSEVPGVNLTKLTPEQIEQFEKRLESQSCTCTCNMNVLECRRKDRACGASRRMARDELTKFMKSRV